MQYPQNKDEFKALIHRLKETIPSYKPPLCYAIGRPVKTGNGTLASVRFPYVNGPDQNVGAATLLMHLLNVPPVGVQTHILDERTAKEFIEYCGPFLNDEGKHPNIEIVKAALGLEVFREKSSLRKSDHLCVCFIFDDVAPEGVIDATLKLYALSCRHFKPNQLNVKGIFKVLPNVAWDGDRPMDAEEVDKGIFLAALADLPFAPHMVDKFPLYIHRINAIKMGVRITDQHKVRLGAYLGEGTTLMAGASYINFNAGTEGPAMVEGRISSGAFVGADTDLGGSSSMLGILSGGNDVPISTGRNCLLEVNCTLGIPIGDACIIASGVSILAGTPVLVNLDGHPLNGQVVKAGELAGINAVTFRRNEKTKVLEVVRIARNIEFAEKLADGKSILSADLHKNN